MLILSLRWGTRARWTGRYWAVSIRARIYLIDRLPERAALLAALISNVTQDNGRRFKKIICVYLETDKI
jgi:hypothetical protein